MAQDKIRPYLEEMYFEKRMTAIFNKASWPFLTTTQNEIVFCYDHGPHLQPDLSGKTVAKLYLNKGYLCLTIWPHHEKKKDSPSETIILLDDVTQFEFSFYNPPEDPKNKINPATVGEIKPHNSWQNTWRKTYKEIPLFAKITIKRKGYKEKEELVLVFDLPSNKVIRY